MSYRIVQIVVEVNGQLASVIIPEGVEAIIMHLLHGPDDKITCVKLPDNVKLISMAEAIKASAGQ